jgi:hypothetical protein
MSDGMGEPPADDAQENDADGAREKPVDTKELLLYLRQYTGDPRREALAADVLQPYEQKIHDLFLDLLCGDVRADVESAVDGLALIRALTPEDKRYEQVLSMVEASFAFARDLRPYILSETYGQCDAAHCDKIMRLRIDEILEDTFAQPAWLNLWGLALRFPSEYAVFKALSDAWANFDRSPETPALDNALAELAITKKNDVVSEKFPAALDAAAGDERYFLHLASGLKWLNDTQDGAFLAEEKLLLETMNARGLLTAAHLRERLPQL